MKTIFVFLIIVAVHLNSIDNAPVSEALKGLRKNIYARNYGNLRKTAGLTPIEKNLVKLIGDAPTRKGRWFSFEATRVADHPPPGEEFPKIQANYRYFEHKKIRDRIADAPDDLIESIENIFT